VSIEHAVILIYFTIPLPLPSYLLAEYAGCAGVSVVVEESVSGD